MSTNKIRNTSTQLKFRLNALLKREFKRFCNEFSHSFYYPDRESMIHSDYRRYHIKFIIIFIESTVYKINLLQGKFPGIYQTWFKTKLWKFPIADPKCFYDLLHNKAKKIIDRVMPSAEEYYKLYPVSDDYYHISYDHRKNKLINHEMAEIIKTLNYFDFRALVFFFLDKKRSIELLVKREMDTSVRQLQSDLINLFSSDIHDDSKFSVRIGKTKDLLIREKCVIFGMNNFGRNYANFFRTSFNKWYCDKRMKYGYDHTVDKFVSNEYEDDEDDDEDEYEDEYEDEFKHLLKSFFNWIKSEKLSKQINSRGWWNRSNQSKYPLPLTNIPIEKVELLLMIFMKDNEAETYYKEFFATTIGKLKLPSNDKKKSSREKLTESNDMLFLISRFLHPAGSNDVEDAEGNIIKIGTTKRNYYYSNCDDYDDY